MIVSNNPGIDHSATQDSEGSNIRAQLDAFFVEGEAAVIASAFCWALHSSLGVTTVNFWDIASAKETTSSDMTSWRQQCLLTQDEVHQYRLRKDLQGFNAIRKTEGFFLRRRSFATGREQCLTGTAVVSTPDRYRSFRAEVRWSEQYCKAQSTRSRRREQSL